MAKTYVPTLVAVARVSHKYGTRWQDKLAASLTSEQYTCLLTWIAATAALLQCITAPPPGP